MTYVWDIPGWVSGFRFDDTDPLAYDATNQKFIDQAGFGAFRSGNATLRAGTPLFAGVGPYSRRGLKLDNSNQWDLPNSMAWEGTLLIAFSPVCPSAPTLAHNIFVGNKTALVSSNARAFVQKASGVINLRLTGAAASAAVTSAAITNASIAVAAMSVNQQDRILRVTLDGVTVTASSALADDNTGQKLAWSGGAVPTPTDLSAMFLRMGNNSGTIGDTTANATDYIYMLEAHQFTGDVLTTDLSKVADAIAERKAYYGA